MKKHLAIFSMAMALCANVSQAAQVARFYLEHTVSGTRFGPVMNRDGYRFKIGGEGYVMKPSEPAKAIFSSYPQEMYFGPYDLENGRIVKLGASAYAIADLTYVDQDRMYVPKGQEGKGEQPEYIASARTGIFSGLDISSWTIGVMGWFEPVQSTHYDWKFGGFEGNKASRMKHTSMGVTGRWGGLFASVGKATSASMSGSVVPDGVSISNLKLDDGDGVMLEGGYVHSIPLDSRWIAMIAGELTYRSDDLNLVANTLHEVGGQEPAESPAATVDEDGNPIYTKQYEYGNVKSGAKLNDLAFNLSLGVEYDADAWGANGQLAITLFSNTSCDGSVNVLGDTYTISGERTHPVSIIGTGWCYIIENVRLEASLSFGGETAVRIGAGYYW